ncbi:MAG TPA: helicase-related protein, partial [Cyclobacteriaceae bacterium]|nr:helicase-related protein [Cyclobacteriaceae bacterium]
RSVIYQAILKAPGQVLDYKNIDKAVFDSLNLLQEEFAQAPSEPGSFQFNENERALKIYLTFRMLYDLKRGWRVILPNLEQVALIKISYQNITEEALKEKYNDLPGFVQLNSEEKFEIIFNTLEYFRTSFAFHFEVYDHLESHQKLINANLKTPWTFDLNEKIQLPFYLRVVKPNQRRQNIHTASIGSLSAYGKYIRNIFKTKKIELKGRDLQAWIYKLLEMLSQSGYLRKKENILDEPLFQLNGTNIIWKPGDQITPWNDSVRVRTRKYVIPKVNTFFQEFYMQDSNVMKPIKAAEHTGQVKNEEREKYESDFSEGKLRALYCSPTMELGVDISELNVVQMRNVPPNTSNYAQRSGRAGRSGQAALVITYCANNSSHDRHYFEHRKDMVAGIVSPPKLDLTQQELIHSHLNALYLSRTNLGGLDDSIASLLDIDIDPVGLPLKSETISALDLEGKILNDLESIFNQAISDIKPALEVMPYVWFDEKWIKRKLNGAPGLFDRSLDRWREIFRRSAEQLAAAGQVLSDPRIPRNDDQKKLAERERLYAEKQIELIKNERTKNNQVSEFYPYRYLAAEGFLPGYGFTKLPVRLFIPREDGEYITRPKFIALREFGPQNIIYHNGGKYRVNQMLWSETDNPLVSAKIARGSGYILMGSEYNKNICPITGADITDHNDRIQVNEMLEIRESRSEPQERITCEEEERKILGYDIKTAFRLPGGMDRVEELLIKIDGEIFLRMQYLPAAQIVQINSKWKISKEGDGYLIGRKTGFWKKPAKAEERPARAEEVQRVKLYAENTADALYIQPTKNLNLDPFDTGVITLMYAIKRAFENIFQVESNELEVALMGTSEEPNILLYESAEGSLGIISQFVKNVSYFKRVINEAFDLCHFNISLEEQEQYGTASYADLLSYFNQKHHLIIDRYLIKDALEALMNADVESKRTSLYKDYEDQYQELLKQVDPSSSTELKFLHYLHSNNLRLPDKAQVNMGKHGCYTIPDFVYSEEIKVSVFCDGTPHDKPVVQESDSVKRDCLENLGFEVLVWHYSQPLGEFVSKRPDIFKKVRE